MSLVGIEPTSVGLKDHCSTAEHTDPCLARLLGFEPRFTDSESVFLPIRRLAYANVGASGGIRTRDVSDVRGLQPRCFNYLHTSALVAPGGIAPPRTGFQPVALLTELQSHDWLA